MRVGDSDDVGHKGNISDCNSVDLIMHTIDEAIAVLDGRKIAVLTGAGVSTDSGIPDYRGSDAPPRTPMTFAQFLETDENRKRYWAGSHLGRNRMMSAAPNPGHRALVDLESRGIVNGIVTQNVDGLHKAAGSARVVELHGTLNNVLCLSCGQVFARDSMARRLAENNPWLEVPDSIELQPDGDVAIDQVSRLSIPECTNCHGMLKPDVVFFGELVPRGRFRAAFDIVREAEALLIAGSSLAVNSGIRLLERAVREGKPVVIINRGATKGDSRATVRLEGGTSEFLSALAERLGA